MPSHRLWRPYLPLVLVTLAALAASVTSLGNGFAYNDVVLVQGDRRVHSLTGVVADFEDTYLPSVPLGPNGRLYRPLTLVASTIQWVAGGGQPFVFHLISVALYLSVALLVFALARRFLPEVAATAAALLFAAHPLHTEAIASVTAQGELLAAFPLILAVVLYLDGRRTGFSLARIWSIVALYFVACLVKEHAVLLPALLLALEAALGPQERRSRQTRSLMTRLAGAAILYLGIRTAVVGGIVGELPHPFWRGAGFVTRLETMLGLIPRGVALLLWPAHLQADYSPAELSLATGLGTPQLFALAILVATGILAIAASRAGRPAVAGGVGWLLLSLAPVSNLLVPTGLLLAERTLFLPSVGVVLIVGGLLHWGAGTPGRARLIGAGVVVLTLLGIVRSATRQPVWRDSTTLFGQTIVDAPLSYWAWRNWARDLAQREHPAEAEAAYQRSLELWDHDPQVFDDFATFSRRAGRCEPAIPLFRKALELDPSRHLTAVRLIGCLVNVGDYASARSEADARIAIGRKEFQMLREMIDRAEQSRRGTGSSETPHARS